MKNKLAQLAAFYSDHSESVPKFKRLRTAIERGISEGLWIAGSSLPTELQLAQALPVSVGTIQKALRDLADDGFIKRRQGSSSIVCDTEAPLEEPWHMRFHDPNHSSGTYVPIHTKVLSRKNMSGSKGRWADALSHRTGNVMRIDRSFIIDNKTRVYARFYAFKEDFPDLAIRPLKELDHKNFKILIAKRYRKPVHKIAQRIRFEVTPKLVAKCSDCVAGEQTCVLSVTTYTSSNVPLYFQDFYIPSNALELDLGLSLRGVTL